MGQKKWGGETNIKKKKEGEGGGKLGQGVGDLKSWGAGTPYELCLLTILCDLTIYSTTETLKNMCLK